MKFGLLALLGGAIATPELGLSMLSVMHTIKMDDRERVQFDLESCVFNGDCSREEIANPRLHAISLVRGAHNANMDHQANHPTAVNVYENCLRKNKMLYSECTSLYDAALDAGLVKVLQQYSKMICVDGEKKSPHELADLTIEPFKS